MNPSSNEPQKSMCNAYDEFDTKLTSLPIFTELIKYVVKFQYGRQCTYNAKSGRIICDCPGHGDWEILDTSNGSALDAGTDDKTAEQLFCTAKYSDGRPCTNKARSGRTTCGIPRHQKFDDETHGDEIDAQQEKETIKVEKDAKDLAGVGEDRSSLESSTSWLEEPSTYEDKEMKEQALSRAKDYTSEQKHLTVLEQQGREGIEMVRKTEGSSVFQLSEDSDSTEDSRGAADKG